MSDYFRPIPLTDPAHDPEALRLAGGWCRFSQVEWLRRGAAPRIIPARDLPPGPLARLTAPRAAVGGCDPGQRPLLMGIVNTTPDSFSDGGQYLAQEVAIAHARAMAGDVDLIDIGGESTRPGAQPVPVETEIARTAPVIAALGDLGRLISIDTRKAEVAAAALRAGAGLVNDVSALGFDPALGPLVAEAGVPVCLMHAQGAPETMQDDPRYDDVLLDVYDALAARIAEAEAQGIARARIIVDPGIGFGKTLAHNLALLRRVSLFHGLGVPVLLGVSRKRFIGTIGGAERPADRMPGSVALAVAAVAQGIQILRIHDTAATAQAVRLALALWLADQAQQE